MLNKSNARILCNFCLVSFYWDSLFMKVANFPCVRYVIAGRIAPAVLRKDVPKLRKATPWDGKDGQVKLI